jgi:hypothetical protein
VDNGLQFRAIIRIVDYCHITTHGKLMVLLLPMPVMLV